MPLHGGNIAPDNVPPITTSLTSGGGCAVLLSNYVYMFGGTNSNAIRRIFIKSPLSTWKWESLNNLPSNVAVPGCWPLPSNKNLIMITLKQPSTAKTVVYDIYQNTVTTATTTPDLYGTDLVEICHDGNFKQFRPDPLPSLTPSTQEGSTRIGSM